MKFLDAGKSIVPNTLVVSDWRVRCMGCRFGMVWGWRRVDRDLGTESRGVVGSDSGLRIWE